MPSLSSIPPHTCLALVALPVAALAACATGVTGGPEQQPTSSVAQTEPDRAASADSGAETDGAAPADGATDGGGSQAPVIGGCRTGRVAKSDSCDDACDARLTLPGGGTYCTVQCGAPAECNAPMSGLACPADVGACMPRCTTDAACKAMGFARCVVAAGTCDTI